MVVNMKFSLFLFVMLGVVFNGFLCADEAAPKRTLKANYVEIYNQQPKSVNSFSEMFKEGMVYGRLRSNTFFFNYEEETSTQKNHITSGLGGSLIYQSAILNDFDFRTGFYYSYGFFNIKDNDVSSLKPGQDVLSRFNYINNGDKDMSVLGQAYIRYLGIKKSEIKIGRQLVNAFYAKSNDSKMIPNTFDAVVVSTKAIPDTEATFGYLAYQKLRGHTKTSSVLVYGDSNSSSSLYPQYSENDDSAMHKGLTYTALKTAGKSTDAPLLVADIRNNSVKNLKLDASFYSVPKLISQAMTEVNYKIFSNENLTITPAIRYIRQFDNGAGAIGGAALNANPVNYKDKNSLNSQMIAARLITKYKNYELNIGYSNVFDESDLVTPWRAFPTAGYTRSMTTTNWVANTKSYRVQLAINPNKLAIYKNLYMEFSLLHNDADEAKEQYDDNYYYAGFIKNFDFIENLQGRIRVGHGDTKKVGADYTDARVELNYLF